MKKTILCLLLILTAMMITSAALAETRGDNEFASQVSDNAEMNGSAGGDLSICGFYKLKNFSGLTREETAEQMNVTVDELQNYVMVLQPDMYGSMPFDGEKDIFSWRLDGTDLRFTFLNDPETDYIVRLENGGLIMELYDIQIEWEFIEAIAAEDPDLEINAEGVLVKYHGNAASVVIPYGVTAIGSNAFSGCSSLTLINIPESISSIGEQAFSFCSSLTSVVLPSSVASIGNDAFFGCDLLELSVPMDSFAEDYALKNGIDFRYADQPASVNYTYDYDYRNLSASTAEITRYNGSRTKIMIPSIINGFKITSIGEYAFAECSDLKMVIIPDGVTSIGEFAFHKCTNLTTVRIPDSVTSIGKAAFYRCSRLASVNIPEGITSLVNGTFSGCKSLTSVNLPESLITIDQYAFNGCDSLKSIIIPEGVTFIGERAFELCRDMTLAVIPESVTSIDHYAFWADDTAFVVKRGSYAERFAAANDIDYYNYSILDDGTAEITAYSGSESKITLPSEIAGAPVTSIGDYAFQNSSDLKSVTIPEGVISIGANAFSGCSRLTSVTIPSSIVSIGEGAFSGCDQLELRNPDQDEDEDIGDVYKLAEMMGFDIKSLQAIGYDENTIVIRLRPDGTAAFINNGNVDGDGFWKQDGNRITLSAGDEELVGILNGDKLTLNIDGDNVVLKKYDAKGSGGEDGSDPYPVFEIDPDGVLVKYHGNSSSVTIPQNVTSIGEGAFSGFSGLRSVTIPEGITSIGDFAFAKCTNLTSITIPAGVASVGTAAFAECSSLKSVSLPESITSIGDHSFSGCSGLTELTIPDSIAFIGEGAFNGCRQLVLMIERDSCAKEYAITNGIAYFFSDQEPEADEWNEYEYSVLDDGTVEITRYLGSKKELTVPSLIYGLKVTSIGNYAFSNSGLTSVNIPENVVSIGEWAFSGCSGLTSINIPENVASIREGTFSGCSGLTSINIPENVTSIEKNAFSGCSSIKSVIIPESLVSIDDNAFSRCSSLTSVTISNSVVSIRTGAFDGCSSLASVTLPESLTSIGTYAFRNCGSLASITIPSGVDSIGEGAFSRCSSLTSVTISGGVTSIGDYAFDSCTGLTSVVIPNSVTSIGSYAFIRCSGLKSVSVPGSVTSIGKDAFAQCRELVLTLDWDSFAEDYAAREKINYIYTNPEDSAKKRQHFEYRVLKDGTAEITGFIGNEEEITIPSVLEGLKVTSIGKRAFERCSTLNSVMIPDSVVSIGNEAFQYCDNLISVTIPDSVTSIGDEAFHGCSRLTTVTMPDRLSFLGERVFYSCNKLASITIPKGVTAIRERAFSGCSSLNSVSIPDSVTSIGKNAFSGCGSLVTVTIPGSVVSIDHEAFYNCKNLTSVIIPDSVTSIGNSVFSHCKKLVLTVGKFSEAEAYAVRNKISYINSDPASSAEKQQETGSGNTQKESSRESISNVSADNWTAPVRTVQSQGNTKRQNGTALSSGDFGVVLKVLDQSGGWFRFTAPEDGDYVFSVRAPYLSRQSFIMRIYGEEKDQIASHEFKRSEKVANYILKDVKAGQTIYWWDDDNSGRWYTLLDPYELMITIPEVTGENKTETEKDNAGSELDSGIHESAGNTEYRIKPEDFSARSLDDIKVGEEYEIDDLGVVKIAEYWHDDSYFNGEGYLCKSYDGTAEADEIGLFINILNTTVTTRDYLENVTVKFVYDDQYEIKGYWQQVASDSSACIRKENAEAIAPLYEGHYWFGGKLPDLIVNEIKPLRLEITLGDVRLVYHIRGEANSSSAETAKHYKYNVLADGTAEITVYSGKEETVMIPSAIEGIRVTSIGNRAFAWKNSLTSVTIPDGVTSIGNDAFYGCGKLSSVTIPESVTSIGAEAFYGCSSLTGITIPGSVTTIGDSAFRSCTDLTSVEIPEGVISLGDHVFSGCFGLSSAVLPGSLSSIGNYAFSGCRSLNTVTIRKGLASIGDYAFTGCTALVSVTLPEGVTSIGDWAFSGCSSLTSLTIPASVNSIGEYAFSNCTGLSSATFLSRHVSIGNNAFPIKTDLQYMDTVKEGPKDTEKMLPSDAASKESEPTGTPTAVSAAELTAGSGSSGSRNKWTDLADKLWSAISDTEEEQRVVSTETSIPMELPTAVPPAELTTESGSSGSGSKWTDLANTLWSAMGDMEEKPEPDMTAEPEPAVDPAEMPTEEEEEGTSLPKPEVRIIPDTGIDTVDPLYQDLLTYMKGFLTGTEREPAEPYKSIGSDLFRRKTEGSNLENTGYALLDIDGNGIEELLLGDLQNGQLYDVYAITGGQLTGVLHSGYKNIFTLNTDGTFTEHKMISAFAQAICYYSYENGSLRELITISLNYMAEDGSLDPDPSWYIYNSENGGRSVAMPISTAEADAVQRSHTPAKVEYTPLLTEEEAWLQSGSGNDQTDTADMQEFPQIVQPVGGGVQSEIRDYPHTGDTVRFGHYEQNNDFADGPEPIEWKVVAEASNLADGFPPNEKIMLLVSTKVLDAMPFNTAGTNSWDNSSLRSWMHNFFFYEAFTGPEQRVIKKVSHKAGPLDAYPDEDTVFILSMDEIQRFLPDQSDRQFAATPYAISRKVYLGDNGLACWWTRTYHSKGVAYNVWSNGETEHGDKVTAGDGGVLPAVWIDLDDWMKLP